jgi:hypothetical protein
VRKDKGIKRNGKGVKCGTIMGNESEIVKEEYNGVGIVQGNGRAVKVHTPLGRCN